ncbi:unnamed protein product [Parnassius mnemosyne]|uniref:Reverse transcriptase domain-containing protein n=1 Tax=Parnassius mnemosyne TaxID=213953 RepID=A0AAV1KHS0_9NEOP
MNCLVLFLREVVFICSFIIIFYVLFILSFVLFASILYCLILTQDKGEATILTLLDFSRAFDTIDTTLLLSKLMYYGFDCNALKWFESYLNGRTQRVRLRNETGTNIFSVASPVTRGVPQGSILGPLLFILYSADITGCFKYCQYHLYADDLQVYISFRPDDTNEAVNKLNLDLSMIAEWANNNELILNSNKTKFMILGSKKLIERTNAHKPKIVVGGNHIEQVSEVRNLGIIMDNRLRFENHVTHTVKNCFYRLKILYNIREYLSEELRIQLCESLILSKLNYADIVMGECLLARTKLVIQRVQNACARFCFRIPRRGHVTPFLNQSKLINMKSRRSVHYSCLLYKILQNQQPKYLYEKLSFSQRFSRETVRLLYPRHRTAAFRGSFRYAATKCWNNIPPPIKGSRTVRTFKVKLKEYLLNLQS